MKVQRSYTLPIYANSVKLDTAKYTADRHLKYVNGYLGHLFFSEKKSFSTKGLGFLANQAQHKALGIINALRAAAKETGAKTNVPVLSKICAPATIEKSKTVEFDYWLSISNQWTSAKKIRIPIKAHKSFNKALHEGWQLSANCEFVNKNNRYYARVFVSKEVAKATPHFNTLGCDVGLTHSVCRSDGHKGHGLKKVRVQQRRRKAERQRQGHKISSKEKTVIKQLLDIEAKLAVRRSRSTSQSLVVESPKILANLRTGKLHGWARSYFAHRCATLCAEQGVYMLALNPAYSSQTCAQCGHIDKWSRVSRDAFKCTACGYVAHADVNAAAVLAQKGTDILRRRSSLQ